MNYEDKHTQPTSFRIELERKLKWLLLSRLAMIILLFGAIFLFLSHFEALFKLTVLYGVVNLGYLAALYYWQVSRKEVGFQFLYAVLLFFELLLEGAMIHYSGGEGSMLTFLFALTILSAAFVFKFTGTIVTATGAVVIYVSISYLEFRGILPPIKSQATQIIYSDVETVFAVAYIQACLLYIVAFFSGYMSQKIGAHLEELMETRRELERVQWNTDQILQNMRSGLITINEDGNVVYYNEAAARVLQLPMDEVLGNDFRQTFPKRLSNLVARLDNAMCTTTTAHRTEITIESRYGLVVPIALVISTLRLEGKIRGVIALFEDITEEKKKEALLQQMEKLAAIGELSARLAHELRNPLAAIRGGVEMLKKELKNMKVDQRVSDLIIKESDRLTQILDEFLTFARLKELPPEQFRTEEVNIRETVSEVYQTVCAAIHPKNTEFKNLVSEDVVVLGRKDQLVRVFENLIRNAVESFSDNGDERKTIVVSSGEKIHSLFNQEELIAISVKDNGPGISSRDLSKIFEPFYTTKPKGVGLGLSIVQGIVNQHGGYIEVKSKIDEYTEFIVYLPLSGGQNNAASE